MEVYTAKIVKALELLYGDLLTSHAYYPKVKEHLETLAHRMFEGLQAKIEVIYREINNYHSSHLGRSIDELSKMPLDLDDCKHTIANEYGFQDWGAIDSRILYNLDFEKALEYLLSGNLPKLKMLIESNPDVVKLSSTYGHEATLLHYTASNGVEFWRQKVPYNLPDIVSYLLDQGADRNAKMKVYGGEFTTLQLMLTSAHPREAGLMHVLEKLLNE